MLASDFTESEIKGAINQMTSQAFFQRILGYCQRGYNEHSQRFPLTAHLQFSHTQHNKRCAYYKKDGAESISDFRPISLIHSFAKIVAKVLAMRLAPHMNSLISKSQSAFIKRRSIHDNFMSVRCVVRRFHRSKTPTLFF